MDKTGVVVWTVDYSAFGQAHITVNTVNNPLRLAGQYFDAETSLHYNVRQIKSEYQYQCQLVPW